MKILQVCDRQGWAVDRLAKPLAEKFDNVDIVYLWTKESRFLNTGYSEIGKGKQFNLEELDKYDVIHFHKADAVINLIDKIKARKIVTKHTERKENVDWSKFDDVICPTKAVYDEMGTYNVRRHLVPHGIDTKKYSYSFKEPDENTVGFVGRVIEHKRPDVLLNACVDANLKMIGVGYFENPHLFKRPLINKKISEGKQYKFITFLPEEQMPGFYSKMRLFCCLSAPGIETGPLPILEALSCGVPVITTNVGWAKDNLTHMKDAFIISDDDAKSYGKLSRILSNINSREDLKGKFRANGLRLMNNFTIDKYCDRLMEIYNS